MLDRVHFYESKIDVYFRKEINFELLEIAATLFSNCDAAANSNLRKIKINAHAEVYQFAFQHEIYYLKRFYNASFTDQIKNLFRPPKALTNYLKSLKLASMGFGIADPVAALVYKGGIFQKESLFITKGYDGITFLEYINSGLEFEKREETLNAFMALLGRFYQTGFVHGDPNLTNFLVHEQNGKPDFAFIDLDSIKHLPLPIHLYTFKSLAKLYSFALLTMSESNAVLVRSKEKGLRLLKTFLNCYNQKIEVSKAQKYIQKNVRYW